MIEIPISFSMRLEKRAVLVKYLEFLCVVIKLFGKLGKEASKSFFSFSQTSNVLNHFPAL